MRYTRAPRYLVAKWGASRACMLLTSRAEESRPDGNYWVATQDSRSKLSRVTTLTSLVKVEICSISDRCEIPESDDRD
jgi:hypothetical protein